MHVLWKTMKSVASRLNGQATISQELRNYALYSKEPGRQALEKTTEEPGKHSYPHRNEVIGTLESTHVNFSHVFHQVRLFLKRLAAYKNRTRFKFTSLIRLIRFLLDVTIKTWASKSRKVDRYPGTSYQLRCFWNKKITVVWRSNDSRRPRIVLDGLNPNTLCMKSPLRPVVFEQCDRLANRFNFTIEEHGQVDVHSWDATCKTRRSIKSVRLWRRQQNTNWIPALVEDHISVCFVEIEVPRREANFNVIGLKRWS